MSVRGLSDTVAASEGGRRAGPEHRVAHRHLYDWGAAAQTAGTIPGLVVPGTAPLKKPAQPSKSNTGAACRAPHPSGADMSDTVLHATDADFDSLVLASDQPVLVDFWAPWCGPCKMIAPALDQLATDYAGRAKIVKVDVDQNQQTALKYHVRSIPMLLLFKGGQIHSQQIGAVGKAQLAQMIDKAL